MSRTTRKLRKRGGSQEDLNWLQTILKPRILELFASTRKRNTLIIPFRHLFMILEMDFNLDRSIHEMVFAIKRDPYERPVKSNACILTVAERKEPMGWSEYNRPTVVAKQLWPFNKESDLGFGLECTHYGGSNLTYILFCCWFYTLKLHAQYVGRPDYIITDYDIANPSGKAYGEEGHMLYKNIVLRRLNGKSVNEMNNLMKDPKYKLYYERFGFTYPEKREYFDTYLRTGEGVLQEANNHPMSINRFYLDLSTISIHDIEIRMKDIILKF